MKIGKSFKEIYVLFLPHSPLHILHLHPPTQILVLLLLLIIFLKHIIYLLCLLLHLFSLLSLPPPQRLNLTFLLGYGFPHCFDAVVLIWFGGTYHIFNGIEVDSFAVSDVLEDAEREERGIKSERVAEGQISDLFTFSFWLFSYSLHRF